MKKIIAYGSLVIMVGCELEIRQVEEVVEESPYTLSDYVMGGVLWEGSERQWKDYFVEDITLKVKESDKNFTGVFKTRSFRGASLRFGNYLNGLKHGDFYTWHDNGRLKSKKQYSYNMRHGYHYEWAHDGKVWSRKKYEDGLEIIGWFEDEGISENEEDMSSYELRDWNGSASQFYLKFAGDPKEGGFIHIRETGKPYTGKVTAFDNQGKKEAVMRFKNGKYEGVVSYWDENGNLWDEKEYERGKLIAYTIKEGKRYDPTRVIEIQEGAEEILFK
jgi:antitoxin component YwqK of YwqJK toxin-antitoxin module